MYWTGIGNSRMQSRYSMSWYVLFWCEAEDSLSSEYFFIAAGVWGNWTDWSACSGTCGMGIRVR